MVNVFVLRRVYVELVYRRKLKLVGLMEKRNVLSGPMDCLENRDISNVFDCGIVYIFGFLIEDLGEKVLIEC